MYTNNPNNVEFTISEGWCPTRKEKLYQAWQHNKNGDGYWVKIAITSSLNEVLERVKSESEFSNKIMTIEWRKW